MQERVAQCRRLAISVMDEKAAALRQMADEIESLAERGRLMAALLATLD